MATTFLEAVATKTLSRLVNLLENQSLVAMKPLVEIRNILTNYE